MNPAPHTAPTVPDLPIHELLALEAVARLGSVQAAAESLHVTPSGVSHRIASLARRIGAPLLRRQGRGVVLTDAAESCVAEVRPALLALADATEAQRAHEHGTVRIATAAAVGVAWLLPRLRALVAAPHALPVELISVATPAEIAPDRWDLMIHDGGTPQRGALRRPLFRDRLLQVCAPALLPRPGHWLTDAELARHPSLCLAQLDAGAWPAPARSAEHRIVFDDALTMLEAAAAGAGVAVATLTAARPYLDSGRLVQASRETVDGRAYALDLSEAGQHKAAARRLFEGLAGHGQRPG